jgi:hypothetical protein
MFPIKAKELLPIDHLVIKSVAVRGALGPVTVWISKPPQDVTDGRNRNSNSNTRRINGTDTMTTTNNNPNNHTDRAVEEHSVRLHPSYWDKLFDKKLPPSRRDYKELVFNQPVRLRPGETRVMYIHSTRPGDDAIVYDNSYYGNGTTRRYEDDKLILLSGRAHVSPVVFGQEPIWGWGNAWRDRREFVGQLAYGTVYKLWNPDIPLKFGEKFQDGCRALFMCQRRAESPVSILPDECLFYVLNMLRWDWFDDDTKSMKARRKKERERAAAAAASVAPAAEQENISMQEDGQSNVAEDDSSKLAASSSPSPHHVCTRARAPATATVCNNEEVDEIDEDVSMEDDDDNDDEEDVDSDAWEEDEDEDEEENEEEEDDDDDNSVHAQYHTATRQRFSFRIVDSDDEDDDDEDEARGAAERRGWVYRQVARMSILRALAMDDS